MKIFKNIYTYYFLCVVFVLLFSAQRVYANWCLLESGPPTSPIRSCEERAQGQITGCVDIFGTQAECESARKPDTNLWCLQKKETGSTIGYSCIAAKFDFTSKEGNCVDSFIEESECKLRKGQLEKEGVSAKSVNSTEEGGSEFVVPDVSVLNKLGTTDINTILGRIIKGAMGIMGSIALVMIVYGGVLWMTASGSAEKSGKAMQILIWSSLGIVLIFASYAVVDIVFEAFR